MHRWLTIRSRRSPSGTLRLRGRMRVELEDETSVFQLSEILSCGRAARGERFAYRYYRNYVEILPGRQADLPGQHPL